MLTIEVQYLSECPLVNELLKNVNAAISKLDFKVDYLKTEIDKNEDPEIFRGCPTLLVDGRDYVGKVKYEKCKPFCREYKNVIPTVEEIKTFILCNY
jgi:hypothetical protein